MSSTAQGKKKCTGGGATSSRPTPRTSGRANQGVNTVSRSRDYWYSIYSTVKTSSRSNASMTRSAEEQMSISTEDVGSPPTMRTSLGPDHQEVKKNKLVGNHPFVVYAWYRPPTILYFPLVGKLSASRKNINYFYTQNIIETVRDCYSKHHPVFTSLSALSGGCSEGSCVQILVSTVPDCLCLNFFCSSFFLTFRACVRACVNDVRQIKIGK